MGHLLGLGHGRGKGGSGKNGSAHGSVVQVGGKNNVAWYCVALYGIVWYCMHGIVCMVWYNSSFQMLNLLTMCRRAEATL